MDTEQLRASVASSQSMGIILSVMEKLTGKEYPKLKADRDHFNQSSHDAPTGTRLRLLLVHIVSFVLSTLLFSYCVATVFDMNSVTPRLGFMDGFILVLFVPFVETLVFQKTIISYLLHNQKCGRNVVLFISAFCFALYHLDFSWHFLTLFYAGLFLAFIYHRFRKQPRVAFLTTYIAHALYNSVVVCLAVMFP